MKFSDSSDADLLHLLLPHVRVEVLRLLFLRPRSTTYGREAARRTNLALRTVQRELRMLESAGLLVSRKAKGVRLFEANGGHRLHGALRRLIMDGDVDRAFVNKAKKPRQSWRDSRRRRIRKRTRGSEEWL